MTSRDTPDGSMETLLTIARLLEAGAAAPKEAIQAAYRLGVLDGGLQMARLCETPAELERLRSQHEMRSRVL